MNTHFLQRIQELENEIANLQKYKFDALTSLRLRIDFEEKLDELFNNNSDFYLIVADINNLHYINREDGYIDGGDRIIKKASCIINKYFDCAYRIGGDEFAIILDSIQMKDRKFIKEINKICTVSIIKKSKEHKTKNELFNEVDSYIVEKKAKLYKNTNMDRRM